MKKILLFFLLLSAFIPMQLLARDFQYTYQGQAVTYTVIDENAKTVRTKAGISGTWDYTAGNSISGNLVLPANPLDGDVEYTLICIGDYGFYNCEYLSSISLPTTVTSIGQNAFANCVFLQDISFPASLVSIGDHAFHACRRFTSVYLPNSVSSLGNGVFTECTGMTSVSLPESMTKLGETTFMLCSSLQSVKIPQGITTLEYGMFDGCIALTDVTLPDNLTMIDEFAFGGCSSLTHISLPQNLKTISKSAFQGCSSLENIEIPNSIVSLGEQAFCNSGLRHVSLPESLSEIGRYVFSSCSSLETITIPNSIKTIGDNAFQFCSSLTEVNLSDSLISIGHYCFSSCNLKELVLPASLKSVDNYAFDGCSNLASVTCLAIEPPTIGTKVFYFPNRIGNLFVPQECVDAYSQSDWATYFNVKNIEYKLTLSASGCGNVLVDGKELGTNVTSQLCGSNFTILILPDDGYRVSEISLDGENLLPQFFNHTLHIYDYHQLSGNLNIQFTPVSDASLTVRSAENLAATYTYPEGAEASIILSVEDGWKLHSITFNDEDVTSELTDNVFTTAPLYGDNSLVIVLSHDITTEIEEIDAASLVSLSVTGNTVTISGLGETDLVSVNDLSGKVVYTGLDHEISLLAGNVYIIATPRKVFKLTL